MFNTAQPLEQFRPKVSIVIPAYNEEAGIENTIRAIPGKELEEMGYGLEVVVVDNNSNDRTSELAKRAGARVIFESRQGYGRAYKTGFSNATGEIIVTLDADSTYPVQDVPQFVSILQTEKLDFITTNRFGKMDKGAMSPVNKFGNGVLSLTARILFGVNIADSQSGMWIFSRRLLDQFSLRFDGMAFSEEIKLEASYFSRSRWKELPIRYMARQGNTKMRIWKDGFDNLFSLFKKRAVR